MSRSVCSPLAAATRKQFLYINGGLSPKLNTLDDIRAVCSFRKKKDAIFVHDHVRGYSHLFICARLYEGTVAYTHLVDRHQAACVSSSNVITSLQSFAHTRLRMQGPSIVLISLIILRTYSYLQVSDVSQDRVDRLSFSRYSPI